MSSLVSIIVPIYNAEKYLCDCIESILRQTYTNFELILIDDGSTDDSENIINRYALKDERIYAFHKKNEGVSVARNFGLEKAQGEYIVFVDSDDLLPINSLEIRINSIKDSDMVLGEYCIINESGIVERNKLFNNLSLNKNQAMNSIAINGELGYQGYLWNKMYKRKIIIENQISFAKGIAYNEDRLFNVKYLEHCNDIVLCNEVVYHYRQSDFGVMSLLRNMDDSRLSQIMSEFIAYDQIMTLVFNEDKRLYYNIELEAIYRLIYLKKQLSDINTIKLKKEMNCYIHKYTVNILKSSFRYISIKTKLKLFVCLLSTI